jgi:hypothetical protein
LARLYRESRGVQAARQTVEPFYKRFTEGFESADMIAAKRLLREQV